MLSHRPVEPRRADPSFSEALGLEFVLFTSLVLMAVVTTLATPLLLRRAYGTMESPALPAPAYKSA